MKWKWSNHWFKIPIRILIWVLIYLMAIEFNFLWLFGKSPSFKQLAHPELNIASELYSADGILIGKYFIQNRSLIVYSEIPKVLKNALLATEDIRFYSHHGIDMKATLAILWYLSKGDNRGSSTITQQLVKNLFTIRAYSSQGLLEYIPYLRTLIFKTKEWINSLLVESYYTKEEIITTYLNTVDFGSNAFGIRTGSKTFFGVEPRDLKIEQAALLVGMLKAPTYYSPVQNPENALMRRNIVLNQMLKYDMIPRYQHDSLVSLPLVLNYSVEPYYSGMADYFREAVRTNLKNWCKKNGYDLYGDGLRIYSSLDMKMQNYAEHAMEKHMAYLQRVFYTHWEGQNPWAGPDKKEIQGYIEAIAEQTPAYQKLKEKYPDQPDSVMKMLNLPQPMTLFSWKGEKDTTMSMMDSIRYYEKLLHAGFIVMDPFTGYIKAWVGNNNFKFFKFDHVKDSRRQPGSTFKAFVYSAAFDQGYGPCDTMVDQPITIHYMENGHPQSWSPHNAEWTFSLSSMTLKQAFAKSVNSIAVQLTQKLGWPTVIEYAHKLGIQTELDTVPSVCLGSSAVTLQELTAAYCPFMNGGYRIDPVFITRIEDQKGKVVFTQSLQQVRALSEETAFLMKIMLRSGLEEPGGTVQALFSYDLFRYQTDFGGKTGTSSDHSDGWFIGVTKDIVAGVWVGSNNPSVHFRTSEMGEGCKTALPIFGIFMENILRDTNFDYLKGAFLKSKGKITKDYSCHTRYSPNDSIPTPLSDSVIIMPADSTP